MRPNYTPPTPTTDVIIEYKNGTKEGIVLIERKNPPYGLAIPGGFAEYGLTLEENAKKEAKEETNLEIIIEDGDRPFMVRSEPSRDPRSHMISVTYIAKGFGDLKAGDDAVNAHLYSYEEVKSLLPKLCFDHGYIMEQYLQEKGVLN